jgi:hypothetical protein
MLVIAFSGLLFLGEDLKALARIHGLAAAVTLLGRLAVARAGASAVALVYVVSWSAAAALLYRRFEKKCRLRLEWGKYLRYLASAAVTAALAFSAARLVHTAAAQLVFGACVAALVYALLMIVQWDLPELVHAFIASDSAQE